jgi:hypothetical protein
MMRKVVGAAGAALGVALVLSAPALAGGSGPGNGKGQILGNSNAVPGQQNCLGKTLSSTAEGEGGLHIGQGEGTGPQILPTIAFLREAAAIEGECGGEIP